MRLGFAVGLSVSCAVVACATGGGEGEGTSSGTPTSNSGGNEGGMAGTGGMGAGGTTAVGGGDTCAEDPCKLVAPQCGCDPGLKCTWANDNRSCVADGTAAIGEVCSGAMACAAGGHCLTVAPLSLCKKYCDSDDDCSQPGGLCALQVTNTATNMPYAQKWCSDNCDLVSSVGCDAVGSKCELGREQQGMMRWFTLCYPTGAGVQGDPCADGSGQADTRLCAEGYSCTGLDANMNPICLKWCNYTSMQGCDLGTTCSPFSTPVIIGTIQYGACL